MEAVLSGPAGRVNLGPEVTVGRLAGNQLVVNDPKASSHHATIRQSGQGYSITDLGSTNGTFVNDQKLAPNTPRTLNSGDKIRIGDTIFSYEVVGAAPIGPTMYGGAGQGQGYDPTVAAASPYANNPGYLPTEAAASPYSQYEASPPPAYQPPTDYLAAPVQQPYQAPPPPAYPPYGASPQPVYGAPVAGVPGAAIPPARQSRRTLWIILGIVGIVVVLGIILVVAVVANASTPTKTLQAYCDAIKSRDYQSAYNLLSSNAQNLVSESQYASLEDGGIKQLGGVNTCRVSNVTQGDTTATGTITYSFGNGQSGPLPYQLIKENNTWKISREGNGG